MPQPPKTETLQELLDDHYYRYGGYVKFVEMVDADKNNAEIGVVFGPPGRPRGRHTVRKWRVRLIAERKEAANDAA